MEKFKQRLMGVLLIGMLGAVAGMTSGTLPSGEEAATPMKKTEAAMEKKQASAGGAKLVMKTSAGSAEVPALPKMEGGFSLKTRQWIHKTWGADAERFLTQIMKTGKLYAPAVGMMDSLMNAPDINDPNWKPLKASDLSNGTHMAEITLQNGRKVGQVAAYTDMKLLKSKEVVQEKNAYQWLQDALYMQESDGAVLNPKTRFMRDEISQGYFSLTRYGLAELLGFLEAGDMQMKQPFHELANKAYKNKKYFQVLYYWGRSYRDPDGGDDWKKAEVSKLRAYHALNFPGSRDRARGELDWMMKTHPADELIPLQGEFAP